MNVLRLMTISLSLLAAFSVSAGAVTLVNCKPAKNCGAAGKPCNEYIHEGATETMSTNLLPQVSVIRVRVCTKSDSVCNDGADTQAVNVYAYKGAQLIKQWNLNQNSGYDTGGYTRVPGMTKLTIRCASSLTANCLVAWQHCLEPAKIKRRTQ
jgi:hypothetical protein